MTKSIQYLEVPVHIWHGEEDMNAPAEWGRYLARKIPNTNFYMTPK